MTVDYRQILTLDNLLAHFPREVHPEIRPNQQAAFEQIAASGGISILELPVGSGKTAIGYTFLRTLADAGVEDLYYIVPNKSLVDQVHAMFPDTTVVYGRNEYDCLYYAPEFFAADDIPCLSLTDCDHRVDQTTGKTLKEGVRKCPYYEAKFRAKQSRITVCTYAYFLYNTMFKRNYSPPGGLVIDEVHGLADVFRQSLSYEITDWHLARSAKLLRAVGATNEAGQLEDFLKIMKEILRAKPARQQQLLTDTDLTTLMSAVSRIKSNELVKQIGEAIQKGTIDPLKDRVMLKQLEDVANNLPRYVRSFEYSMDGDNRHALNYVTYAYSEQERGVEGRVQYKLIVRGYYVAPLIRKLLSSATVAMSGTIGDSEVLGFETGIRGNFASFGSSFPVENTRIFMPTDTPNLATRIRNKSEPTKVLRRVAKSCLTLSGHGLRSMVVVVSNTERDKFLRLCKEEQVHALSADYEAGITAREAMMRFKSGEGMVLVGTVANYGEGIDLPDGIAPVVFFLRPDYPNPYDPQTQFEEQRFGGQRWKVWRWRQTIRALQVRGRNVRSAEDRGATIFVSQQFREYLYGSLPEWLKEAYDGQVTLVQATQSAKELLH